MKKLAKIFSVLASLALLGSGFVSCSGDEETVIVKPSYKSGKTITVTGHKTDKIKYGNTEQLAAVVLPEDEAVTWHSSDESIVTVSSTGLVTAEDVSDAKVQVWAEISDGTKSNEVNYLVMQEIPKITGISLVSAPAKEKYATGTFVNLSGLKIAVEYDVPVGSVFAADYPAELEFTSENSSQFAVSGFDSSAAASGQTVTVTYNPVDTAGDAVEFVDGAVKTVTFDVDILSASVTSVTVNSEKSKIEYLYSNVLEPLDVSLDIAYSASELDETISALTNGVTMTVNGYDFDWSMVDASWFTTWTEDQPIGTSITFTYGGVSTSSPLDITFDAILAESVSISSAGSATTLESGSTLQFTATVLPENATVNAMTDSVVWSVVDDDGTGVTIGSNGLLSAESAVASGKVKVKAAANDTGNAVSSEIEITIPVWLKSISVTSEPSKTEYLTGDSLDSTGLEVTALYSDGTSSLLASDAYSLNASTLSTAGTIPVTVTLKSDTSKTAEFDISVIQVYNHGLDFTSATAASWDENFAYSKITANNGDTTKAVFDGTETGFEAYLKNHIWMQKGATALVRTDKNALFLNRTSSTGEGAVTEQSPVLIATEVAGKYRIVVDLKATSKNNTGRTIYIRTLEENAASADGTTTQVTVPADAQMTTVVETTHGSESQKVITYEYMGDSPYSIVGIGVPEGEAVYINKILIYTVQETYTEPSISIAVKSVSVKDASGSVIATNAEPGSLSLVKAQLPYKVTETYAPAAAGAVVEYSLVDENNVDSSAAGKVHVATDGTITLDDGISGTYTGLLTVSAGGVCAVVELEIDCSVAYLKDTDTLTVTADSKKVGTNEAASLTAELSVNAESLDETVSYQWKTSDAEDGTYTDIDGATSSTYAYSSDTEGSAYFKCVVTGGTSGVSVSSDAVKITVSDSAEAVVVSFTKSGTTDARVARSAAKEYSTKQTYDGVEYSYGAKLNSTGTLTLSLDAPYTVTFVLGTDKSGYTKGLKIDGAAVAITSDNIVTVELDSGDHTVMNGGSETSVFLVILE